MNAQLKKLFVATANNKVELFETNLADFVKVLNKAYPESRNFDYYYREFKKSDTLNFINSKGEVLILQKVL